MPAPVTPQLLACPHYAAGRCRSCSWLERPYDEQLAAKQAAARQAVGGEPVWEPPVLSAPSGFRNKAKMVVSGTAEAPTLGILGPDGGIDLSDCALHLPGIQAALPVLAAFVTQAHLVPYDVATRTGELKHVLVTESPDGELMIRWVLRSTEAQARVRKHLPWLVERLPQARVVTLNIQPQHAAILEGEREIVLTSESTLPMRLPAVALHLGPRSFFQTNTAVATALYQEAATWVADLDPRRVIDLYCGVGGFALHLAAADREVTGIEISADAIGSAERSRDDADLPGTLTFAAGDATAPEHAALLEQADLIVVNPPRRGLGSALAQRVEHSGASHLLYSSCNPDTLARDLAELTSYAPVRARLFDMFPQTPHSEVLVLLSRGQRSE